MSFYQDHLLPRLLHCACGCPAIDEQRRQVVPAARGQVLEVGFGSGLNLPHYDCSRVEVLWALEPAAGMRQLAQPRVDASGLDLRWLASTAEALALPDRSIDSVVITFTLCTIADGAAALAQIRRVLRPAGQLLFCEHGTAPDASVRRWQDRLNRPWSWLAGGCNLNRDTPAMLANAGFRVDSLHQAYLAGAPRWAGFNTWGSASPG